MAPLRLVFSVLTLTSLGLVLLSNANTAVALNLLGFTSRSLPLSLWMLAALGAGLALSFFFEGLFALTRWQPRNPKGQREPSPGPRPRGGYAEEDAKDNEFVEENFSVPQRDRYSRPDPEAPWDDPTWVAADRDYDSGPYDDRYTDRDTDRNDDRTYDKRDYNQRTYGRNYDDHDSGADRESADYQPRPFSAKPKDRSGNPAVDRPNRVYDADFRILDDNNPRPEPLRRAQPEPTPPRNNPVKANPDDDWGDWNDNDPDW
jgi:hypothetical protein